MSTSVLTRRPLQSPETPDNPAAKSSKMAPTTLEDIANTMRRIEQQMVKKDDLQDTVALAVAEATARLQQEVDQLKEKVDTKDRMIAGLKAIVDGLQQQVLKDSQQLRRRNIRIYGLPTGTGGKDH